MTAPFPGAVLVFGGMGPQWMDRESIEHLRRQGIPVVEVQKDPEIAEPELPAPSLECYVSEPEPVAPPAREDREGRAKARRKG